MKYGKIRFKINLLAVHELMGGPLVFGTSMPIFSVAELAQRRTTRMI